MLISERKIWTPDNSFLLRYREKIISGEILAGMDLKTELDNLAEDMKNNEDFFYDTDAAMLRMDFMAHCVRLTKSPFYGKQMVLMDWQQAYIEALYGFKMAREFKDTGKKIDRFKRSLLLISRKNTKSETCSALGNAEFIVGNDGSDLVCSSNDDAQASIVYDAIDCMRKLYDPNDLDTKRNQRFILNKSTNTKIFKISDRTKNKEGRNIDFAILDEVHEMKNNGIAMAIEQSQSLKENPKFIEITTEGFEIDGYLDSELKKARKVIYGEDDSISAQRFLPWLYTQDSVQEIFQNPRSWQKSNPTVGIVKPWSYLEEQVDRAKKSRADRIYVLAKDFNVKQGSAVSWLELGDYDYQARFDIEKFRGSICMGHVDLAETTDLCCAKALLMLPDDPVKYVATMYFIPQSKLDPENDDHNADAKYKEWAEAGYITICDGNDIDLAKVADWFYELYKFHGIKLWKCGYDQKFAKDWMARMEYYGWSKTSGELEMIQQDSQTLNNALRLVEADLKARLINYDENPVDKWCFKNSCLKLNDKMQALCVKEEKAKKIDGSVTLISLYEMFRRHRGDFKEIVGKATT